MARIVYNVPMVRQGISPICWVACAAMILSFKGKMSISIGSINGGSGPSNSCVSNPVDLYDIIEASCNDRWVTFYSLLIELGFTSEGPNSPSIGYIERILRHHSPFILTHYTQTLAPTVSSPNTTHAVVITGIDTNTRICFFNNPWGTRQQTNVNAILADIVRLKQHGIQPVAYIP